MSKLKNMRGIEIKKFRAVSSGLKTLNELFGEDGFHMWVSRNRHLLAEHMYEPTDLLWHNDEKISWDSGLNTYIIAIRDGVTEADVAPYEIFEFPGGMFLVATGDEKDNADLEETIGCMMTWIKDSTIFEYGDFPKSGMCNMPNADGAFDAALGIAQQQIYLPLKLRSKQ
jgi:hypothetical protein